MKVAVLYICTGRYSIFWQEFFLSAEKHLLADHEKHYFVFTDQEIPYADNERVHRIEQEQLPWPSIVVKRFHIFSKAAKQLNDFDFILFFNANTIIVDTIGNEIIPSREEGLMVCTHPCYYKWKKPRWKLTYDRNPQSQAYIPWWKGGTYVCGGLNGGLAEHYLQLIYDLKKAVDIDERNGVIALWHDESHLNKYILDKKYKLLHPGYMYPEESNIPFPKKVHLINKKNLGGHAFLRGQSDDYDDNK